MRITGGRIAVDVLAREGVDKVFCVPGESYLTLLDALYDYKEIEVISNRHEAGAIFMADSYARVTGKVGVCMASRGPGASNLTIGVHTAYQDSTPVVVLLGDIDRNFEYREALQEIDLPEFFKPISKWAIEIRDVSRIAELLHRAFYVARSGRPGPVVVALPHDVLEEEMDPNQKISGPYVSFRPYRAEKCRPTVRSLDLVVDEIVRARRPIVIAGGGIVRSDATSLLVEVAEQLQIPVATSFRRFDAFPNEHPCYAGPLSANTSAKTSGTLLEYIRSSDVSLVLGTRLSQVTTQNYTLFGPDTKIIHVDVSSEIFGKSYPPFLAIISDAKEFLSGLKERIQFRETPNYADLTRELHESYIAFSSPKQVYSQERVNLEGMMFDFVRAVPHDAIIACDAGNFFGWLSTYYRYSLPGTCLGPTSGAMGYGLPAAIAAKIAYPRRTVVSFSGDGGFMMTLQEFETAVRYQAPVIAIVINNYMYGTIRAHQERKFPNRVIATTVSNPDFAALATAFGGHGERVFRNTDFIPALERAMNSKKPAIIEVVSDTSILSV